MRVHEFLASHLDEVCDACVSSMKQTMPDCREEELRRHFRVFACQVTSRLRHGAGLPEEPSLPEPRETAECVGHEVHRQGLGIEIAAQCFATLSIALGDVGGRHGLAFDADEYGELNRVIDDSVRIAIERFAKDEHLEQESATRECVGTLAHELRNAITSAKLAFGALERREVGVESRTGATLRRSLSRMNKLIEQALADVRLRQPTPLELYPLLISPLLQDVGSDCVLEREIRVVVEADESLVVLGDEQLLTVAVGNLVQNAIKCSRNGALVTLRVHGKAEAIVVEVEDECGGLEASAIENIFLPFVQQRTSDRGLGLGLAITRRAADALAGRVAVHDLPGKGCVFALHLRPGPAGVSGASIGRRSTVFASRT